MHIHHPMCCFEVDVVLTLPKQSISTCTSTIQCVVSRLMWYCRSPNKTTVHAHPTSNVLFLGLCRVIPPQTSDVLFCSQCSVATPQTKQQYTSHPMCCFAIYVVLLLTKQNRTSANPMCCFEVIATPQTKHYISHLMCCFAIYVVMPLPKQNISTSAIQFVVLRLMWLLPLPPKNNNNNIHHHPMRCFEVHEVIVTPQAKQHTTPSNVLF